VDEGRIRAVINTYYSLTASCIAAFAISALVLKEKISMVHIQNATLAGGVGVGTMADQIIQPWAGVLIGAISGALSVLGFRYIMPLLRRKLNVHDTCGVHNLHGMPGLMSGFGGILSAGLATQQLYGDGLTKIFAPGSNPQMQAAMQAASVATSLGFGLIGGTIVGFILKIPIWDQPKGNQIFDEEEFWDVAPGIPEVEILPRDDMTHGASAISIKTIATATGI